MTRVFKKEMERIYAVSAAKALGEIWFIDDIPEPLDFMIRTASSECFGLEVVELYDSPRDRGGSALKQIHGMQQKNLRDIVSGYYRRSGNPVRVNFLGCIDEVEKIIDVLISVGSSLAGEEVHIEIGALQAWILPLPKDDARFARYGRWQIVDVSFVRSIPDDLVLRQISSKSQKLDFYMAKAEVVDLLLVVDRTTGAGRFNVSESLRCANTGFRRVILLNYPLGAEVLSPNRD
ncbi:hypothetical protein VA602_12005 [Pseudomonas sp. MH2]|uniref:KaiC-like domain-containing protein n=1 Tax=Pseudomonas machongensis TaxID=3110229 RepID=A0ABU5VGG1_9PSED|nr:hypothetical protein [Pseudomonas sp. MH2]MEA5672062.1 hypothetical protein [Pseudomonas sp. MH2]